MTLPTPEALREAVERVRSICSPMNPDLEDTPIGRFDADLRVLVAAASLLLSEEWQGWHVAATKWANAETAWHKDIHSPVRWAEADEAKSDLRDAAYSLARKLAAQEKIK